MGYMCSPVTEPSAGICLGNVLFIVHVHSGGIEIADAKKIRFGFFTPGSNLSSLRVLVDTYSFPALS